MSDTLSLPVVGDRYRRNDRVVEIIRVDAGSVTCRVTDPLGSFDFIETLETFRVLEKRSFEKGAKFEPANHKNPLETIMSAIADVSPLTSEQQCAAFNHLLGQIQYVIESCDREITKEELADMVKSSVEYGTI